MSLNKNLMHAAAYAHMIDMLLHEGGTVHDLHEETGMNQNTIRKFTAALRRRKLIYVARWEPNSIGRHNVPNYRIGEQSDARTPPKKTNAQKKRDYEDRRRAIAASLGLPLRRVRMRDVGRGFFNSLKEGGPARATSPAPGAAVPVFPQPRPPASEDPR
jgi:hypothetical protein